MVIPTVISTFAGCGGSSLGYHLAGYDERLAVEWDDNAAATFKMNFPRVPLFHGDIKKLSVAECLELAKLQPGELDVFDGSPPCQGFSTAGERKLFDPRNELFLEYCRLLKGLKPKAFVMENVTGMIKGHMKQAYLKIISELRDCGYKAKGAVMNACYFGVPQSRERVIIIGIREDLPVEPSHPRPSTKPISVRDAIGATGYIQYRHSYGKGFVNFKKSYFDKPCLTICKSYPAGWDKIVINNEERAFTLSELKTLASFPVDFKFTSEKEGFERIGNSVPPLLMKAIATHIKSLLGKIE